MITLDVAGATPTNIVWDITYACPLRCAHCYSESGRRPSRQLRGKDLLRVTDAMLSLRPRAIVLAGGEPLLVPELFEVAGRIAGSGTEVHLYTGGWDVSPDAIRSIFDLVAKVTVSIDGARERTHDRLRGRAGSFQRALRALAALDAAVDARSPTRERGPAIGVDYAVTRSNIDELPRFCTEIAPGFRHLDYVFFGAVMPIGLASRPSFTRHELLDEAQLRTLRDPAFTAELQRLVPRVAVHTGDNGMFQMHPDRLAAGEIPALQVEPDGRVRAMPVYEGTVGSLLEDPPQALWERAVERWNDPFVTGLLRGARTMHDWAEATRQIDVRFGTGADVLRIRRRPPFDPARAP